jgi:hypothetical protein
MVEEKVARTRRTNERIVIDAEEAPEDADATAQEYLVYAFPAGIHLSASKVTLELIAPVHVADDA